MAWFAECSQCGWIGSVAELKEHPTRPMPTDFGFCPECATEIDDIPFDEIELERRLIEYGYET